MYLWGDEMEHNGYVKRAFEHNMWQLAYRAGYREPRFPVPAIRITGEYVTDWEPPYCYFGAFIHDAGNLMRPIGVCWRTFPPTTEPEIFSVAYTDGEVFLT